MKQRILESLNDILKLGEKADFYYVFEKTIRQAAIDDSKSNSIDEKDKSYDLEKAAKRIKILESVKKSP